MPFLVLVVLAMNPLHSKLTVTTNDSVQDGGNGRSVSFPFYIYRDNNSRFYYATGWMGDYADLKLSQSDKTSPFNGKSCMKFSYSAKKQQKRGWVGVYWQNPMNNWGAAKGGYDLTGARKLFFRARGEKGGEIAEFKMGGLTGNTYSDTASATAGSVTLTPEWKLYSIDLTGLDLTRIIGGFCVILNSLSDPDGCTFYVDDVYYSGEDTPEQVTAN